MPELGTSLYEGDTMRPSWKVALVAILTLILTPSLNVVLAQPPVQLPREETVYESSSWGPPAGTNPMLPSTCWGTDLMYPFLFLYSPYSDEWIPYAAESFRWIDAYTLEVKIRDEAKWWDGVPITAYDVEYTLKLGKKYAVPWSGYWDYLDDVKAVGPKTVRFILKKEKLNYYQLLAVLSNVPIMPKHRWEKLEEEMGADVTKFKDLDPEKIVGGGPYKLLYVTENEWAFERVDDWWGKDIFGLPRPKYVVSRVFKDNVAAALAFEKGELDFMTHFTPKIWEMWTVKKLARRTYYAHPPYYVSGGLVLLYINWKYPLNDTNVRRAIAYALPIDDMIKKCYYSYGVKASPSMIRHMEPVYAKWIDEDLVKKYGFTYNLSKAKEILDKAGIIDRDGDGIREMPDGTKLAGFTIRVPYGWTDWMCMCKMIADNLKK
ncbi:MAG: ABC transporter substrate-binding protein, partial [Thermoprotei archaeon]